MKYPKVKLFLSLLICAITLVIASNLNIESNMEDMLPKESESLQASKDFSQYFDGDDQVIVMVKSIDSIKNQMDYESQVKDFLDALHRRLINESYIDSVLYKMDYQEVKAFGWAYVQRSVYEAIDEAITNQDLETIEKILLNIEKEMAGNPIEYLSNSKQSHYMMVIKPNIDSKDFMEARLTFYNGLNEHIDLLLNDYDLLEVGLTGGAFIQDLEGDTVAFEGLFGTLIITLLLVLSLVVLFFGQLKLPLLALYPLLLGGLIAAASATIIYGNLNMFSVSFALLLVGLGIDFAVHLIARYQEERSKGQGLEEAVRTSVKYTGGSIIMGAGTTAFAFASFTFAQFKAFEQMGVVSAIGLVALCLMMLLLVPSLIQVFDKKYKVKTPKSSLKWLGSITKFNIKRPYIMVSCLLMIMVLLFNGVKNTTVQSDLDAVYPADIPSAPWTEILKEEFDYDTNTITFYVDHINELEEVVEKLEQRSDVLSVQSVLEYMPKDIAYKLEIITKLDQMFKSFGKTVFSDFDLSLMTLQEIPKSIRDNFIGKEGKIRGEIVPNINIYDEASYEELRLAVMAITGRHPVGLPTIMNEVTVLVKEDMTMISGICMLIVFLIGLIAFRSFKLAIVTIMPLLLTLYFTLGLLQLLSVEINIFSVAAFPLIIGIGIDGSIHLIHRLRERSTMSIIEKVSATGKPIMLTGLTTMIGFGSLININHPGMSNLGITVAIGIGISMLMTLLVVPICINMMKKEN